jgi:glycosyltransferase involved in cell wall biosynthesis
MENLTSLTIIRLVAINLILAIVFGFDMYYLFLAIMRDTLSILGKHKLFIANSIGYYYWRMGEFSVRETPRKNKVVACIPAFNAAKSLGRVIEVARKYVDEVIVVNDGSNDNTESIASSAGATVVNHSVNLGYGAAITSCLKAATQADAQIVITLDADLQHNPEDIPLLMRPILEGKADIVTGSRFIADVTRLQDDGGLPAYRRFGITVITKVTNFMAQTTISDATTGFRAYSSHAATALASMQFSPGMGSSSQILMEASISGLRIIEVPVKILYVTGVNTSTHNSVSMGLWMLGSILRYIIIRRPLSLIGIPGLAILSIGIVSLFLILDIFNTTRMIPVGLGMFTVATAIIGLVILLGSLFLYSLSTNSKQIIISYSGKTADRMRNGFISGSKKTSILRYITIRRPLSLIGIPGLAILSIGIVGLFLILDIFNTTRMIPIGLGMFTVATAIIGLFLMMTSIILYTMSKLLKA